MTPVPGPRAGRPLTVPQLRIRVGDDEWQAWTNAADKADLDLSSWIRTACNVAANHPREPAARDRSRCRAVVVP